jgi:hypothetical protein
MIPWGMEPPTHWISIIHAQQFSDIPARLHIVALGKIALVLRFGQLLHLETLAGSGCIESRVRVAPFTLLAVALILRAHHRVSCTA